MGGGGGGLPMSALPGIARGGKTVSRGRRVINRGLKRGWPAYPNERVAPFGENEQDILNQFLTVDLPRLRESLGSMSTSDSLGRASGLLQPMLQRSIETAQNSIRERQGATGNLFSSGEALAEGRAVGDVTSNFNATLAGMLPQLDQNQLTASGQLSDLSGRAMGMASIPRMIQQQDFEAQYQEFLRTNPTGGPLQALMQMLGNSGTPQPGQGGPSGIDQMMQMFAMVLPLIIKFAPAAASSTCWVAAELFGGWFHPKTIAARRFVNLRAPVWFRRLYLAHGARFAAFLHRRPFLKVAVRPVFEVFARLGRA